MPAQHDTSPNSAASAVRAYIQETSNKCTVEGARTIVCGDFNAAFCAADRPTHALYPQDLVWQRTAVACGIRPAISTDGRAMTFQGKTRIDDFLCDARTHPYCTQAVVKGSEARSSDHVALTLTVDLHRLGAAVPPPPAAGNGVERLQKPIPKPALLLYKDACTAELDATFLALADDARQLRERAETDADASITEDIEAFADRIDDALCAMLKIAHETCPVIPAASAHNVANPFHLPRKERKEFERLNIRKNVLRDSLKAYTENLFLPTALSAHFPMLSVVPLEDDWPDKVRALYDVDRAAQREIVSKHRRACDRRATRRFASCMKSNRRQAYRKLYGDKALQLTVLRDDDELLTQNEDVLVALAAQYGKTLTPVTLAADEPPPWLPEHPQQAVAPLDPFTPPPPAPRGHDRMYACYSDSLFHRVRKAASNNKAEGPDGVPVELLKYAPDSFNTMLYEFFGACFRSAHCPSQWKNSTTVLIHKAGDPTSFSNWRTIGLLRTIYKLYTGVIDALVTEFADCANAFSESQEGFRKNRNCERQILTLHGAISDAHDNNRELHVTYIDFRSAFPSISHERLPAMLRFSGIPEDAIAVICNLYSGASTQIRVPAGSTEKIPVCRGVIQGDCISPTIFNLFVEPLLHWFDQGSCGYTPSCIKAKLASLGYADDLSLLNEKVTDSQWQMEKVHRYSAWAGMDLNVPKCAHSALHHGSGAAKLAHRESLRLSPDGKHTHAVTWKGTPLPFLEADESYKYLGVHTALTLNPKDHVEKLLEKIDKRLEKIAESAAIGTDVATVINETVLPCLDNALAAAVLSPADIRELQTKLNIAYKRALGISKHTSSAMLSHPREQFGFGINTLMHRYIKTTNRTISTILTDKGIPGQLARALMKRQLTQHGMSDESITSNQWRWLKSP
jgi:hypothetical protein